MSHALPLAAAQARLGRPGRPRKHPAPGHDTGITPSEPRAKTGADWRPLASQATAPLARLLDVEAAAVYLGISPWTVRDLHAAGRLPRVRLPAGQPKRRKGRLPSARDELRRLLFDRGDLDRLVEAGKERE